MANVLDELKPDLLIVLGDRFETLGTAIAAHLLRIPIGHIHGGEISEGMMDEGFRHSITKFSHLHFVSTREYAMRVIQLGEDPKRVFVVGSLGVERLLNMKFIERAELELHLNLKFSKKNILITFHPVTLESKEENEGQFRELLKALDKLSHTTLIFTFPNMDIGSSGVAEMIKNYVMTRPRAYAFSSLGQARYFSLMKIIDVVVGNSSSGVIEAPSLKKPTINIGDRQAGRIKASSVIDCQATESDINRALEVAFSNEFQQKVADVVNPYEKPGTSLSILEKIKTFPLEDILKKRFVDLKSI
jgi:GDP/UDP-N,N'-diacetylbacillosamine 2-epimerase (hydrolysing)